MTDSQQPQRKPSENKVAFWLSHCEWTRSEIAAILLQAPIAWILSDSLAPQWSVILPIIAAYLMIHRNYRTFCLRQFERPQQQQRATPKEQQPAAVQQSQPQAERYQSQQQQAPNKRDGDSQAHQRPTGDQDPSAGRSASVSEETHNQEQTGSATDTPDSESEDTPSVSYEIGDAIAGVPPVKETLQSGVSDVRTGDADFRSILLFGDSTYNKRTFFEEADLNGAYLLRQFDIDQSHPTSVYEVAENDTPTIVSMVDKLEWFASPNATASEIAPQKRERFDELAAVLEDRPEDTVVIGLYNGGEVPGEIATLFDNIVAVEHMSRSQRRGVIMSALKTHGESLPEEDVGHAVDWLFGLKPATVRTVIEMAAEQASAEGRPLGLHDIERVTEEEL
jgi:hypothetical protein